MTRWAEGSCEVPVLVETREGLVVRGVGLSSSSGEDIVAVVLKSKAMFVLRVYFCPSLRKDATTF